MIRITAKDFEKLIALLKKDGQTGAHLTFRIEQTALTITTMDRSNKEMVIQLSDVEYPFLPRVIKTETF